MEEYIFSSKWNRIENPPTSATRCLVTDGEIVIQATYIIDGPDKCVWIFPDITHSENFNIIGWMELPKPMKKSIPYENNKLV